MSRRRGKSEGGPPPEGHERQCRAQSRGTRRRCRKWAIRGRDYCEFHGGRASLTRMGRLSSFYRKHLGPTRKAVVDALCSEPQNEQGQVWEEIALARAMALQAIKLAEPVLDGRAKGQEASQLAVSVLAQALSSVRDLCLAASRIEKDASDKVSLATVRVFIDQVNAAVARACGEDVVTAGKILEEISRSVRVPSAESAANVVLGTEVTPDSAVGMMDDSVCGDD